MHFLPIAAMSLLICASPGGGIPFSRCPPAHAVELRLASASSVLTEKAARSVMSPAKPQESSALGSAPGRTLREQLLIAEVSGVLLDWDSGKTIAVHGDTYAATPGSILKPFLLAYALQHGIVEENTQVYCRRSLHVGSRSLACSHGGDQPLLDAKGALAESCNTWFAAMARRMTAADLRTALREASLPYRAAHFEDADVRVLTALGLENVSATPTELAAAYRSMLLHQTRTSAVWRGLEGSVRYGMANHARVQGIEVLGKTGTASNTGEWRTHGWFAGAVPGRFVLVIYVPRGDGGTAASLAGAVVRQLMQGSGR